MIVAKGDHKHNLLTSIMSEYFSFIQYFQHFMKYYLKIVTTHVMAFGRYYKNTRVRLK